MGEWFKQLPKKLAEFWNKYTARQKVLFFSVAAAVIITLVALFFLLNRTTYVTLSVFEDTGATAEAATLLEENGIKIKVSNDALKIEVAEEQVSQARLLLGQHGCMTIALIPLILRKSLRRRCILRIVWKQILNLWMV